jgi:hypothetical protein
MTQQRKQPEQDPVEGASDIVERELQRQNGQTASPHVQPHEDQEHRIKERAYQIWLEDGRPEGREGEHWERASREIKG